MPRTTLVFRLVLPTLWIGFILALAFIEAPLKFTAPGITIPLGLGIGRLVFNALAIASWAFLAGMVAVSWSQPRIHRSGWVTLSLLTVVLAVQTWVIRPLLNARSDIIIAGGNPGDSWLHYGYIATDLMLIGLLLWWLIAVSRRISLASN